MTFENTPRFELKKLQSEFPCVSITSAEVSEKFIRQFYGDDIEIFESVFLLCLNQANKTIGYAKISQGGISGAVVDVRIVAKYAVESLASSVILAHNHPSGNLRPSQSDRDITKRIKSALELLDIKILDHLILTNESFFSFANEGLL